ncbi:hypothetical protein FJTKL_13389 [Diaporthe vaccinii]|uniref:Uncharacterized protein n=1 Tax=Diaporthe vaccinii TaxID=105482 RepID=A0ABR4EAP4_9PEZI
MYNFEFTVPPQQLRMEKWIVHGESPRRNPITSPVRHVAKMQLLLSRVMTAQRGNINFMSRPGLSLDVFRRTHWRLYRLILHARKCRSASLKASRNKSRAHICRSRFQKLREPVFG